MFGSQVDAPVYGELELMSLRYGFFQNLDTFRIRQTNEAFFQNTLQTFYQALVKHIVQELHVIGAVIQSPLYAELDEFFRQVHVIGNVVERDFRLNHPELRQVTGSIGVFGAERRSERIDSAQCRSGELTFQLAGNRQAGLFAEEIVIVDNGTVFIFLQIIQVHRSNLEHLSGAFTVRTRNDRRMEIEEPFLMEELMNGDSHIVTNAEHSAERIRTRTQMGYLTKELHRVSLFLQRICIVASSQHFDFTSLDFGFLTGAYRFRQHAVHAQTSACGNIFQHLLIEVRQIHHNLHIIYCRTVVQRDKINLLTTSAGTNPAFHVDHSAKILALQQVNNLCSTNFFHKTVIIPYYIYYSKEPIRRKFTSGSVR